MHLSLLPKESSPGNCMQKKAMLKSHSNRSMESGIVVRLKDYSTHFTQTGIYKAAAQDQNKIEAEKNPLSTVLVRDMERNLPLHSKCCPDKSKVSFTYNRFNNQITKLIREALSLISNFKATFVYILKSSSFSTA